MGYLGAPPREHDMSAAALSARATFAPASRLLRRRASFSSSVRASRASMPSAPIAATSSPRDFPDEMRETAYQLFDTVLRSKTPK